MATRYWVGGNGSWDTGSTANWSTTSGGAGGASAPTSADDVIFNAASASAGFGPTPSSAVCKTMTCTGYVGNINGAGGGITASGNVTLASTMGGLNGASFTFAAAGTFTTFGLRIGTLTTNGPAVTIADYLVADAVSINGTATLNAASIPITVYGGITVASGATVNLTGATITINIAGASAWLSGGGKSYPTVNLNLSGASPQFEIRDSNTFSSLNVTSTGTGTPTLMVAAGSTQTVAAMQVTGTSVAVPLVLTSGNGSLSLSTSTHTLTKTGGGTVVGQFLTVSHSVATPADTWKAVSSLSQQTTSVAGSGWAISGPPFGLFGGSNY